jgi:hypothetical protein
LGCRATGKKCPSHLSLILQNVTEYGEEICGQWHNIDGSNEIITFLPDVSSGYWQMPCPEILVSVNLPMPATSTETERWSKKFVVDKLCLSYLNRITSKVDSINRRITEVLGGLDIPESKEYG